MFDRSPAFGSNVITPFSTL